MRRTVRTVTALLFLGVLIAIGLAVLYFGTSSGIIAGGEGSSLGGATRTLPYYAQLGWLRNTAPWPITITGVTTNAVNTSSTPVAFIESGHSTAATKAGQAPEWAKSSPRPPYHMAANSLRYLGWAVMPTSGQVAYFTSYTVYFTGPLGIKFHKTFTDTNLAARSATLPNAILSTDPSTDSTSLNNYVALLESALAAKNVSTLAVVMGNGATTTDARALLAKQRGYTSKYLLTVTPTTGNPDLTTLTFAKGTKKLAPIPLSWAGYRWTITH